MKCEKCGREVDCIVIAKLSWCAMRDDQILVLKGVSPARRMRTLCLDCFERCAEVFKKEVDA